MIRLSSYPENVRRRLRRKLRALEADRELFMADHPSHVEAARVYDREQVRVETLILRTFTPRWRDRLARLAADERKVAAAVATYGSPAD